jgi:hypothetical protein
MLVPMLATALASFTAGAVAQTATADAEAEARAAQQNAITDRYLTAVQVEMAGKVDTKNAVVGQEVSAKTLAEARLADGTVLPRGTRLVGYVTQVRAGGPELGAGILTLTFDRAELKPGQSVPVRCVIRAVAPNASATNLDMMAAPPTTMSTSGSSVNRTGRGGVAGGMPGTTVPTMGGGVGGVGAAGGSTIPDGMPGSTDGTIGAGVPGGTGSTGPSLGGSGPIIGQRTTDIGSTASMPAARKVAEAGESLSGAPHATGLPGVMLWATPTASGTLTAMGRNVSLDRGMQMTLGVITR